MTKKQSIKKGGTKGKTEGSKGKVRTPRLSAADFQTAERIRALLADPTTKRGVKSRLEELTYKLYAETNAFSEPTPDSCAADFINGTAALLVKPDEEARAVYDEIVRLAEESEPEEYKLARRVSELINSDDDGCAEVVDWFMQLTNDAGVSLENEGFCVPAFVEAARLVSATKPVRRITRKNVMLHGAQKAYEQLKEIVRRVDAGESLARIRDERQRAIQERGERYEAEEVSKPEPKDKTSDEWRYWKLRRIAAGFDSEDVETYGAAWAEFWNFFDGYKHDRADVRGARRLLPMLIIAYQDELEGERYERRMRAGMKGAKTRKANKAKAAKK
jgi:hypothetical protein